MSGLLEEVILQGNENQDSSDTGMEDVLASDSNSAERAEYKIIRKMLNMEKESGLLHIESEYSLIARVFQKCGGSWIRFFRGSIDDIDLLRKVIETAIKTGRVSRSGF